jgi:hypothetical protein
MAQLMRYHQYPAASLSQLRRQCNWGSSTMMLTTRGGIYEWEKMPLVPASEDNLSAEECQAIGKLTSDAGISVYMQYSDDESGAFAFDMSGALKDYWRYGSAVYFNSDKFSEADLAAVSRKVLYSNFDAGLPVLMGIPGHQILADGYGWNNELEYVHLNMGWADQHDVWYNLPEMKYASPGFNSVDDFVYNVVPGGNDVSAVISGRTLDADGKPLAKCAVKLYRSGALVAEAVSSDTGVWGLVVEAGTYQVAASSAGDGLLIGELEGVTVGKPKTSDIRFNGLRTVPTVRSIADAGNSWGNDIVLKNPSVRVGGNVYGSLEKALEASKELSIPLVEILATTELRKPAVVDFGCIITSIAAGAEVIRRDNAALTVAAGGSMTLSNVVFAAGAEAPVVEVLAGGKVSVGEGVSFGQVSTAASIVTADAAGFELSGRLTESFGIVCEAAATVGDVFGYAACDYQTAVDSAIKIVDVNDLNGEISGTVEPGSGSAPFALKWALQPVPYEDSVAYFVDGEGVTNCFRRFDRLFEVMGKGSTASEIVLRENGSISAGARLPRGEFTLRGENGEVVLSAGFDAGFIVGQGSTATVSSVVFDGFKGNALFYVDGGALKLEDATVIRNVSATNWHSGAVAVMDGALTVGSGVEFQNCRAEATGTNGRGGAIYVGEGCSLEMNGGVVSGCHASYKGGGIFAARGSKVSLSGVLAITGNTSRDGRKTDDLCLDSTTAQLIVAGPLLGEVGTWCYGNDSAGRRFSGSEGVDSSVLAAAARCFFNNVDATLVAAPADGGALQWANDDGTAGECAEADAAVRVLLESASEYRYYADIDGAFSTVNADATVEVLKDGAFFRGDLAVSHDVVLRSAPGSAFTLMLNGAASVSVRSGASLVLQDIALSGSLIDRASGYTLAVPRAMPLVDVSGSFILGAGASLTNTMVSAAGSAALTVRKGGTAYLEGGEISGCEGVSAGGVYIASGGSARVSGDARIAGNTAAGGKDANVCSDSVSGLVLAGDFTGAVGVAAPSSKVFGRVSSTYLGTVGGDFTAVTNGAAMFVNDVDGSFGVVATNSVDAAADVLLVWRSSLAADGTYTDASGDVYIGIVDVVDVTGAEPLPIAFTSISRDGDFYTLKISDAVAKCWYYLYSTNSISGGFRIDGGANTPSAAVNAAEDGELTFKVPASGDSMFWKVLARPELEPLE